MVDCFRPIETAFDEIMALPEYRKTITVQFYGMVCTVYNRKLTHKWVVPEKIHTPLSRRKLTIPPTPLRTSPIKTFYMFGNVVCGWGRHGSFLKSPKPERSNVVIQPSLIYIYKCRHSAVYF